jgi:hypothetical protein
VSGSLAPMEGATASQARPQHPSCYTRKAGLGPPMRVHHTLLVTSLMSFFSVPKEENDIRMVYDETKSGLNSILWAPWFPLPTIEMHLCSVVPGTYMGDIDNP